VAQHRSALPTLVLALAAVIGAACTGPPASDPTQAFSCSVGAEPVFGFGSGASFTFARPTDPTTVVDRSFAVAVNPFADPAAARAYWSVVAADTYGDPPGGFQFVVDPNPTVSLEATVLRVLVYDDAPLGTTVVRLRGFTYDDGESVLLGECFRRITLTVQ
jgi:hypothetical protein